MHRPPRLITLLIITALTTYHILPHSPHLLDRALNSPIPLPGLTLFTLIIISSITFHFNQPAHDCNKIINLFRLFASIALTVWAFLLLKYFFGISAIKVCQTFSWYDLLWNIITFLLTHYLFPPLDCDHLQKLLKFTKTTITIPAIALLAFISTTTVGADGLILIRISLLTIYLYYPPKSLHHIRIILIIAEFVILFTALAIWLSPNTTPSPNLFTLITRWHGLLIILATHLIITLITPHIKTIPTPLFISLIELIILSAITILLLQFPPLLTLFIFWLFTLEVLLSWKQQKEVQIP